MAPKPIEDIHFSDLSDKILELLRTLWTLIRDLCIVLWSHISQAFWVVWTYPPIETFRNDFTAALIALWDYGTSFVPRSSGPLRPFFCVCFSRRPSVHFGGDMHPVVHRPPGGTRFPPGVPFTQLGFQGTRRAAWCVKSFDSKFSSDNQM